MRGAFGLVALLVAFAIVIWLYANHTSVVSSTGVKAQEEARQIAGLSTDGEMRFMDSLSVDATTTGGKTVAILVLDVKPQGPAATHFGLQRDDMITEIGALNVKENVHSPEEALAFLHDAYARKWTLQVIRNDKTIQLPGGAATATASGTPMTTPPPNREPPKDGTGALQRQLDNITGPR